MQVINVLLFRTFWKKNVGGNFLICSWFYPRMWNLLIQRDNSNSNVPQSWQFQSMGLLLDIYQQHTEGSRQVKKRYCKPLALTAEKAKGNPLQCSCLENPRDGRAWWAAVYGVAQSWTRRKRLSSSCSSRIDKAVAEKKSSGASDLVHGFLLAYCGLHRRLEAEIKDGKNSEHHSENKISQVHVKADRQLLQIKKLVYVL